MGLQYLSRCAMSSIVAIAVLSPSAMLACSPPSSEVNHAEISTAPEIEVVPRASRAVAASPSSFTLFESGQVRPLAISPDHRHLFAVNTPDNRLEIFRIEQHRLVHTGSIPVGLEPVAVAARTAQEVWVVNHLSDSVSVVELDGDATAGHVARTLLVGDEPRDIVFAGPDRRRAFITTAHPRRL